MPAKKKTTKKKTTKRTSRRTADVSSFFNKHNLSGNNGQRFELPEKVKPFVDEANRRRVEEGENSSAMRLAAALKNEFKLTASVKTIRERISEYIGRNAW